MRKFKHLSGDTKRSIYVGYLSNEPKLQIAKRLNIDNATVHYHINKIKNLTDSQVYALIKPYCEPCQEGHTSFKCLVCGKAHDNVMSDEFQELRRLRERNALLEKRLSLYENPPRDNRPNSVPIVYL